MARKTTMPEAEQVHGRYNELGYQVFVGGEQVYHALNHIHDTHAFADPSGDEAVPVGELKRFCEMVCQEEAAHRGLTVSGIEYEDWK